MKLEVKDIKGGSSGEIEVRDDVFGVPEKFPKCSRMMTMVTVISARLIKIIIITITKAPIFTVFNLGAE